MKRMRSSLLRMLLLSVAFMGCKLYISEAVIPSRIFDFNMSNTCRP